MNLGNYRTKPWRKIIGSADRDVAHPTSPADHTAPVWAIQALKALHNLEVSLGHLRPAQAFSETSLNTLAARSKAGGPVAGALSPTVDDGRESPGHDHDSILGRQPLDSDETTMDAALLPDSNLTPEQVFDQIVRKLYQAGYPLDVIVDLVNHHVGIKEPLAYCDLSEVQESIGRV